MTMELKDLETFLLIVKTGSFTEAAKILYLTQPGISRRVRQLETELNGKLFEKVGNKILLTPMGQELVPHAEEVMQSVTNLVRTFERRQGLFSQVTIALSSTLAGTSFSARYKKLPEAFPHVEHFELRILNDDDLSRSVLKGESDIGVRFFHDESPNIVYHPLREDPFVLVCAANSQWFTSSGLADEGESEALVTTAEGTIISRKRLNETPWLTLTNLSYYFDPITQVNQITKDLLERLELAPLQKIECYGWGVTKNLVQQDHGIALLPYSKVVEEVARGELAVLKLPVQPVIPVYGIHRKHDVHATTWQEILRFLAR